MSVTGKLRALRERSGLSMAEIAKRSGWRQASSYQRYEDDRLFTQPYLPIRIAEKLKRALVGRGSPPITVDEVMELTGVTVLRSRLDGNRRDQVEVIAVVEAGAWREAIELPPEEREYYPLPPLPGLERTPIYGLRVRGSSMNLIFPDNSIVYFAKVEDYPAVEGCYVVVAAQRGDLYETTLKQLGRDSRGKAALLPRSDDPRYQKPIYPNGTGAESVKIIGVVVGVFQQIPLPPAPIR